MAIIKNKFGGVIEAGDSSCATGLMNSVLSGSQNTNTAQCYTTIVSGLNNTISGAATNGSAILSGQSNTMSGGYRSVIAGGWQNTTSNQSFATISGGRNNTIGAWYGTVSGGWDNTASGNYSYVGGGKTNIASGDNSSVVGGCGNQAASCGSFVGGGLGNTASGTCFNVVVGGSGNKASCQNEIANFIGGGESNCLWTPQGRGNSILGGSSNTMSSRYQSFNTISGGCNNSVPFCQSCSHFIGGGSSNSVGSSFSCNSSILGGENNCAIGSHASVLGGSGNTSYKHGISGGINATACNCAIAMGYQSQATSSYNFSTGYVSLASGSHGMALGYSSCAAGRESAALGRNARAIECRSTAFAVSTASGCDSIAGAGGCAAGHNSVAFGDSAYTNLKGQFASSSGKAIYSGGNQISLISAKLDSGYSASGTSYSFTLGDGSGINFQSPNNETVPYNMFLKVTVVFGARGVATDITTIAENDLFTASYELCVRKKMGGTREILGTPQLTNSFSDPGLSSTVVNFAIAGGTDLDISVTPPSWTGGNIRFIGTASIIATQMGMHSEVINP